MTWLVVLQVIWCVDEREVREQTLCGDFAGELEDVVVGILGIIVDAFLYLEYLNREDWRFAVSEILTVAETF